MTKIAYLKVNTEPSIENIFQLKVEDMDGGIDGSYIVFYKNQLVQILKLFFR